MMDVDPKIIKRTQDSLGKIIRKPTLTDKLLSRPPFRFLHDIFTAFIRTTGLMKGLFTAEELIADNVKEKESKLAFLQKVVDYLSIAHDTVIPVRIMSIIAGKDPEKTNELLFLLAETVNKKVDNDECVARVLQGATKSGAKKAKSRSPEATRGANKDKSKHEPKDKVIQPHGDKSVEREASNKRDDADEKPRKHRKSEKEKHEDKSKKPPSRQKQTENDTEPVVLEKKDEDVRRKPEKREIERSTPERKERDKSEADQTSAQIGAERTSRGNSRCESIGDKVREEHSAAASRITPAESPVQPAKLTRPPSAKGNRVRKDEMPVSTPAAPSKPPPPTPPAPVTEENKSSEALEARLAPPRPRRPMEAGLEDTSALPGLSGARTTGLIITESHQESDEDDAQFVIEETVGGDTGVMRTKSPAGQEPLTEEHGGLVTKMLQSKREFEGGNLLSNKTADSQALGTVDELTRQRERAQIEKEVTKLCEMLQALSRSAMPLGKLMDFVQEDLESMQQEYERWTAENQTLRVKLREEESRTQSSIEPLRAQLTELQNYAIEQRKAISTFKAKILANDERIQDLLSKSLERVH